ncbi:hypothetical protein [Acetobacter oeni]|nr:hypothetical protein [Acetobacter oeni]
MSTTEMRLQAKAHCTSNDYCTKKIRHLKNGQAKLLHVTPSVAATI